MIEVPQKDKIIDVIDAGITEYRKAYDLQKELLQKRQCEIIGDTLLLVEHLPVFTVGRMGSKENLLVDENSLRKFGMELIAVDRGGDITFHGPGQLVLYPILDLRSLDRDIHLYMRRLEGVIIDFLAQYNVLGFRIPGATGVWVEEETKIGSIGIGIKRWITYHGLSVNVNTPLYYFDLIAPCGLTSCKIASLSSILKRYIKIDEAKNRLIKSFEGTFPFVATHYQ